MYFGYEKNGKINIKHLFIKYKAVATKNITHLHESITEASVEFR